MNNMEKTMMVEANIHLLGSNWLKAVYEVNCILCERPFRASGVVNRIISQFDCKAHESLLNDTLNRVICPGCKEEILVLIPLTIVDFERHYISVITLFGDALQNITNKYQATSVEDVCLDYNILGFHELQPNSTLGKQLRDYTKKSFSDLDKYRSFLQPSFSAPRNIRDIIQDISKRTDLAKAAIELALREPCPVCIKTELETWFFPLEDRPGPLFTLFACPSCFSRGGHVPYIGSKSGLGFSPMLFMEKTFRILYTKIYACQTGKK